jgi:hypothetical protein
MGYRQWARGDREEIKRLRGKEIEIKAKGERQK